MSLAPGRSPLRSRIFCRPDAPDLAARGASSRRSSGRCDFSLAGECCCEMSPRVDAELAIGPAEVLLDGLRRNEQRLGDFFVAQPLGRHLCNAPLARGQLVDTAQDDAAWTRTSRRQLLVAPLRERARAALVSELDPLAQQLPGLAAAVAPA